MATRTTIRNILYYPTIDIPDGDWLRNSILYWDQVSSIIPQEYETRNPVELSKDVRYLMDKGIFRPIRPEEIMRGNWEDLRDFASEMINLVESSQFQQLLKGGPFLSSKIHRGKLPTDKSGTRKFNRIHQNKTSEELFYRLKDMGLARQGEGEWLQFESHTALAYMSILAKYLARVDKEQTVIGTDSPEYEKLNFQKVGPLSGEAVLSCNFNGIIPSPRPNVTIRRLVSFKKKRNDNLASFRKLLMDVQKKISKAESKYEAKEILVDFQETIQKGVKDLSETYKDSKIDFSFKSIKSLLNIKSSTLVVGGALALNEKYKLTGIPPWISAIALGIAGTIDIASLYIDSRNKRRAADRGSAFSYLYHAQRRGIVSSFR